MSICSMTDGTWVWSHSQTGSLIASSNCLTAPSGSQFAGVPMGRSGKLDARRVATSRNSVSAASLRAPLTSHSVRRSGGSFSNMSPQVRAPTPSSATSNFSTRNPRELGSCATPTIQAVTVRRASTTLSSSSPPITAVTGLRRKSTIASLIPFAMASCMVSSWSISASRSAPSSSIVSRTLSTVDSVMMSFATTRWWNLRSPRKR